MKNVHKSDCYVKRAAYNYVEPHPWRHEPEHRLNPHAASDEDCQFEVYGKYQCSRRFVRVVERTDERYRACGWHSFLAQMYGWKATERRRG